MSQLWFIGINVQFTGILDSGDHTGIVSGLRVDKLNKTNRVHLVSYTPKVGGPDGLGRTPSLLLAVATPLANMIRKFNLPALAADENLSKKSPCSLNINDKLAANCKAIPVFASSIDLLDNHNKQNTKLTLHLDDREEWHVRHAWSMASRLVLRLWRILPNMALFIHRAHGNWLKRTKSFAF